MRRGGAGVACVARGGSAAQNCLSVCRENSLPHRRRPAQAGYRMRLAAALAISASVAGAALLVYTRRQRRRARALRCQPCDSPRSPPPGAARARRQSPDALQAAIAFDGVDTPVSRQTTRVFDRVDSPQTIQARCSAPAAPKPIGSGWPTWGAFASPFTGQKDSGALARPGRHHEAVELHLVGRLLHGYRRALFLPVQRSKSAGACHTPVL